MTKKERMDEVRKLISDRVEENGTAPKSWLVQELIDRHSAIDGADRDWYLSCAYDAIDADVRRALGDMKRREDENDAHQADLFEFGSEKLQKRYVLMRNGESTVVAIDEMTDEEVEAKAVEHDKQAAGHIQHAKELRQFARERRAIVGGAA